MNYLSGIKKAFSHSVLAVFILEITVIPFTGLTGNAFASYCGPLASTSGYNFYDFRTQVGGVSLDMASQFLANMTDVTGAYFDQTTNRIVFVGRTNTQTPQYNKDDMAVAIRALVFNNTLPQVNIGAPVNGNAPVTFFGGIENTVLGQKLFNADYQLKTYLNGTYPSGQVVASSVPGYVDMITRYMHNNPATGVSNASRFWISPQTLTLKRDNSSNSFVFDQSLMQVSTAPVQTNDPAFNTSATQFSQFMTANYDAFANESTSWMQVKELAKFVGIVKWLKDNGITTDYGWAKTYTPQVAQTPTSTPAWSHTVTYNNVTGTITGGVVYDTPNTYLADDGSAASLKTASQSANVNPETPTWNFTQNATQYQSVAVSADAFNRLGGYATQGSDLQTPIAGGNQLGLNRTYSSMSSAQNGVGNGWDMMPARLTDMRVGQSTQAGLPAGAYQGPWPLKLGFQTQDGLYETYSYVSGGTYAPDNPAYHSSITRDSSGFFTATLKDQRSYKFDPNEYLIRTADKNGYSIWYAYTNLKVSSIQDDNGHTLTLTYNAQGLLSTLSDWAGRTVTYGYDGAGNLVTVTDPRAGVTHYAYDVNNKLTTVTDRNNSTQVTNTYNSEAKLATQIVAGGPTNTFAYDEPNRIITNTDSNGRVNKTYYDSQARILERDDPYTNKVFYTYGVEASPLTVKDKNGNINTYTYDANGNTASLTYPSGKQVNYTYDSKNNLTNVSDGRYGATPKVTTFTYDSNGNMTQKNDAGRVTSYGYTYPGSLISQTDALNNTTRWTRDVFGNKLTETAPDGNVTTYLYDSVGRLTQLTDPSSKVKNFTYDNNNNVLTIVDSAGTTTNSYNGENQLTQTTSPTSAVTQYAYNAAGSQASTTDALTHVTGYTYDQYQNMTARQDALTHTTQYAYDQLNRKTSSSTTLAKTTLWTYDANGNITARTDASNRITHYQYDNQNRLTLTTYPDATTVTYTYDDRGNMLTMTSPVGTSTYVYDNFEHMTSSTDPHSQTIGYQYDAANNMTQMTYPGGNLVKYAYDSVNRLRTVTDWNSLSTNYQYNSNGTLSSKTLPNGIVASYSYDNANRLTGVTNSKNQQVVAQYGYVRNANGNITSSTEAAPQTATSYTIMDEGLTSGWGSWSWGSTLNFTDTTSPYAGTKDTAWTITGAWGAMDLHNTSGISTTPYSAVTVAVKATGSSANFGVTLRDANDNALGNTVDVAPYGGYPTTSGYKVYTIPLSALGGSGATVYGVSLDDVSGGAQPKMYVDSLKLTTASATPITVYDEGLAPNFLDWSWGSINNFNDTSHPYVGAKDLNWTNTAGYGGLDLGYPNNFSTSGYQTLSVAIRGTQSNQVIYTQLYDNTGTALSSAINIAAYGGNPDPYGYKVYNIPLSALGATSKSVSELVFQDQTGQTQTAYIDEMKLLPGLAPTAPPQTSTFAYDSLGRVLSAAYPSGTYSYTYDADGNRLTSNEAGTSSTYTINNDNQITAKSSRALTYDNQGNQITDGTKTLAYNFDNRLTSYVNGAQTTSFKYDGAGNRIEKNINGVASYQFVNDLSGSMSRVLVAKNIPGATSTYYIYDGPNLVSQGGTASTSRQYYLDDGIGNIRAVVDSTGNTVQAYSFDPYGNQVTGSNTSNFNYENQQMDSEMGLYYLRARSYDPTLGSFTSRDPINGTLKDPQTQNGYNYANDNPINISDPSGLFGLSDIGNIFGGIANAIQMVGYNAYSSWNSAENGYCTPVPGIAGIKDTAQYKKLSDQQIQQLKRAGYDIHVIKDQNGALDLYYSPKTGEVFTKPVGGGGMAEPVGINIRFLDL